MHVLQVICKFLLLFVISASFASSGSRLHLCYTARELCKSQVHNNCVVYALIHASFCTFLNGGHILYILAFARYLNDANYHGGFEQQDLDGIYASMKSNFRAWSTGFVAMAVGTGGDNHDQAKQDYGRTFPAMRPDVALSIAQLIFQSDFRSILPQVTN